MTKAAYRKKRVFLFVWFLVLFCFVLFFWWWCVCGGVVVVVIKFQRDKSLLQ